MCHPWLAAGLAGFLAIIVIRELRSLLSSPPAAASSPPEGILGSRPRHWFRRRIRPLVDLAVSLGFEADTATLSQLASSSLCAIAYASGWTFTAGLLLIVSGTLDVVDGEIARLRGHAGPRGAFMDSVVDRYAEALVFAGLIALYRNSWVFWLATAGWAGAFVVSYARARAESLGISCSEGWLQRPERYVILGGTSMIGTMMNHLTCNVGVEPPLLTVGIGSVAILANVTALQRILTTLRRLA